MSDTRYNSTASTDNAYTVTEAAQMMDELPETAQTVVQELWYGDSHQNEYDLERHTDLAADSVEDAVAALEQVGMIRSRPDFVSDDNTVYWLNVEEQR